MIDQNQAPQIANLQNDGATAPAQPAANQLNGIQQPGQPMQGQGQPQQQISKEQVIAGLHHLGAFVKVLSPLLSNPQLGKANMRPKIFDGLATLIGEQIFTVPEVMNGIKDLPDDPVGQKKWLEQKIAGSQQAEKKLVSDYISQGPGPEPQGKPWSQDTHKDHMAGLMANYKR